MCPDVASLGVDTEYRLETLLEARQRRSMTLLEEIIVLSKGRVKIENISVP